MLRGGRHACMQAGCSSSSKPWTHHAHSLLVNNTVLSVVRTVECNYQPKPKTPSLAVALTSLLLICSFQLRSAFQQPHTRPYVQIVYSLSWVFSKEHRPTGNELSGFRWLYQVLRHPWLKKNVLYLYRNESSRLQVRDFLSSNSIERRIGLTGRVRPYRYLITAAGYVCKLS